MQKITFSKKLSTKFKISRKQAESLIKNKKVTLNGDIETRPFLSVTDKATLKGFLGILELSPMGKYCSVTANEISLSNP